MNSTIRPFNFPKYFLNDELSDFRIICEGQVFPCHTVVLKKRCNYFKTMLESGFRESIDGEIVIEGAKAEDVKTMLHFIYKQEVPTELASRELILLGDRFNLQDLITTTLSRLLNRLRFSDFEVLKAAELFEDTERVIIAIKMVEAEKELNIKTLQTEIIDEELLCYIKHKLPHKLPHARKMFGIMLKAESSFADEIRSAILVNVLNLPNSKPIQEHLLQSGVVTRKGVRKFMDLISPKISAQDIKTFLKCIRKEKVEESLLTKGLKRLAFECAGALLLDEKIVSFIKSLLPEEDDEDICEQILEGIYLPKATRLLFLGRLFPEQFDSKRVLPKTVTPKDARTFLSYLSEKYLPSELASRGVLALGYLCVSDDLIKETFYHLERRYIASGGQDQEFISCLDDIMKNPWKFPDLDRNDIQKAKRMKNVCLQWTRTNAEDGEQLKNMLDAFSLFKTV